MTDSIAGLPFWTVTLDADGDPDAGEQDALFAEVAQQGITDLMMFSHGWNNDPGTARKLFNAFFGVLAGQLGSVPADRPVTVGLAGVIWPSKRWSDEPIPDFSAPSGGGPTGAASIEPVADAAPEASSPTLDPQTLADLRELFPSATEALDRMAALLEGSPTDEAQAEFHECLRRFAEVAGTPDDDGEGDTAQPAGVPRMLADDPRTLFLRYRDTLTASGVQVGGDLSGEAGIGDWARGIWNGAKEALRQATYWEM